MATIMVSVHSDSADLSLPQLAVFLNTYLEQDLEVRGLATALNISKPVITWALDRLSAFALIKRERDRIEWRSVIVRRVSAGAT